MTRARFVLCVALVGTMGACGGRAGLRVTGGEAAPAGDGSANRSFDSGAQNGPPDGDLVSDTRIGAAASEGRAEVGASDTRIGGGTADVRAEADRPASGRDAAEVEAGRREASTPIDGPLEVGSAAGPTLSSVEISPPNPTVNVGVPLSVVITAVYSDGSSKDVSGSSVVTSSSASIVTVSGVALSGVKAGTATITASYQGKTASATVTVVATILQSINIQAGAPVPIGQTINLVATGLFADRSKQDVTSQATWISSNAAIATVGNTGTAKGQVTGMAAGTVTVTATIQAISGTAQVTVAAKKVTSIQITPTQPILQRGVTQPFLATAVYDDNSTGDVTQQAIWSAADTTVLTVVASGTTAGLATAQAAGTTSITATLGTVSGTTPVTVTAPPLTSITVTPATATIVVGATTSFTAQGSYGDGTTADLTDSVTWSSSNTTILSVSNATGAQGQATALAPGTANVQATLSGVTGTVSVAVTAPRLVSIAVTPNPASVPVGVSLSLKAIATYADQTTQDVTTSATWTVQDGSIATVGNVGTAAGQVTGVKVGSTTVTATLSGLSGSATLSVANPSLVSITVAPATATVTAGNTQAFTATANYSNSTTLDVTAQVTWSSSNPAVAQVSNAAGTNGVATSLTQGTATITATMQGVQGTATLTVSAPLLVSIMVTPAAATIAAGATEAYRVTGVYQNGTTTTALTGVTWTSSSTGVATVTAGGADAGFPGGPAVAATATGVAAGTTSITATYTSGSTTLSDSATLTVNQAATPTGIRITPATATINVGDSQAYTVDLEHSDGTTTAATSGVTLTTSNGAVAAVAVAGDGRGGFGGGLAVTGAGGGTATITATYAASGQTFTDTATITVTPPLTQVGLYLTPATASVQVNGTQQFAAYATYSDGTRTAVTNNANCSWTTSDGTLATVTSAGAGGGRGAIGGAGTGGLATGVAAGSATVNATFGGFSATATLTVTTPVTQVGLYITPATASLRVNGTQQFAAYATYGDGTSTAVTNNANCSWGVSDGTLATISTPGAGGGRGAVGGGGGGGLATAVAPGKVTINASYGGFSATATLTVTAPVLTSLAITPATATILVGQDQPFAATAVYDDGTTANVTASATWNSSDATVAVMSVAGGGRGGFAGGPVAGGGTATALGVGTATVSATYTENGVSKTATAALTVTNPQLLSFEITPTDPTVSLLSPNQAFVATAIYADYSTANVTTAAAWSSSSATVAVISNSGATTGRATGLAVGSTTITATYAGMSASTTLTVVSRKVTTVQVTPTTPTAVLGINQAFVATAIYDDSSTGTVTGSATWTSSNTAVAGLGIGAGTAGVASPIEAGSTTVTATYQGVSGSTLLTVSSAKLTAIAITPSPLSVAVKGTQQLTATGTWSDSSTRDITNTVTWLSSSDGVATISNAAGSRGLFTAVSAGPVTVTAEFQGVTATLVGTVSGSH